MPADFNTPILTTAYTTFLSLLKERDVDALTLCVSDPSNIPTGAMKWNRGASKFQEWIAAAWQDKVLSIAGGGTGAITAATARTALGLGSMSTQDANAVTITGGSVAGTTDIDAGRITSGVLAQSRLGSGSDGSGIHALFDDQTYKTIQGVPVGTGHLWFTDTPPAGYLLCDGTSVLRATYPALFAIIGVIYGSVDGTHFTLPDLRQRFPLGRANAGTGSVLAATGGLIDHAHTSASHHHAVVASNTFGRVVDGTFSWLNPLTGLYMFTAGGVGGGSPNQEAAVVSSNTTDVVPADTGTNNPPFLVINYIIKT